LLNHQIGFTIKKKKQQPILYAHPQCFNPLALATVRGFEKSVASLLEDKSCEADDAYLKDKKLPSNVNITPLQIASANYIGSRLQKHLNIVKILVVYGSNINIASFWSGEPPPRLSQMLNNKKQELISVHNQFLMVTKHLNDLQTRRNNLLDGIGIDYEEIDQIDGEINIGNKAKNEFSENRKRIAQEYNEIKAQCESRQQVNDSSYVMALKYRNACNDNELLKAMIDGGIIIKKKAILRSVPKEFINEECAQTMVEFIIGLPLRKWDV